ncbi:MAG: ElyC/SanA/YdcF family protein [bacterium]|nr:ElyC/SanA/YdcF family protein [bacterium]
MVQHIVVVCGYGCHLVPELKEYLNKVIQFTNQEKPDCFILCGGFTQRKSAPGVSEAALMKSYIVPQLKYIPDFVFLEEDSYTSPDNIQNAAVKVRTKQLMDKGTKMTVFCEATRALKVDLLIRHFFGRRANIETASWELMSPQKQIVMTLYYDWAAIKSPLLADYFRHKRLKRAEQI